MGMESLSCANYSQKLQDNNSYLESNQMEIPSKTDIDLGRYHILYDIYSSIYFTLDAAGVIISINEYGLKYLEYQQEELIAQPIWKIIYPADKEKIYSDFIQFLQQNNSVKSNIKKWEFRLVNKQGLVLWMRAIAHLDTATTPRNSQNDLSQNEEENNQSLVAINPPLLPNILLFCEDITDLKIVVTALWESEERLRATFEQNATGIAHINIDNKFLRVNQKLCDILGKSKTDLLKLSFADIFSKNDINTSDEYIKAILSGELLNYTQELQYIRENHGKIWIKITVSLVRDYHKNPQYFTVFVEDITTAKKTENALQESAKAWQTVLETVGEGITLSNADGRFEVFNSRMEEITGYTKEEANNCDNFLTLLYPDYQEYLKALAGVQEVIENKGMRDVETTIKTKYGEKKTLLVSTSIVPTFPGRDVGAIPYLFLSTYRDISDRKRAEEALLIAEAKYRGIFEKAVEGIFQTSPDGKYISANPALARIFGYSSPGDLINNITDISQQVYVGEKRRSEFIAAMETTDALFEFESQVYRKDGSIIWISENVRNVRDSYGKLLYYEGTVEDITSRIKAQEALQQQANQERLLSMIQSRIRQSLNLRDILITTVEEVRQVLMTDRVMIYSFQPDNTGIVVVEALAANLQSVQGMLIKDPCFADKYISLYQQGRITAIEDIYAAGLTECYIELLETFQVRANLVVPILTHSNEIKKNKNRSRNYQGKKLEFYSSPPRLWGLIIAHECTQARRWKTWEIELLSQLATQVGIAIHQSELYQQLTEVNAELERQVEERTAQLQKALDFEAMLKRITDKVRDSLDEKQILKTAVKELVFVLGVRCCDTALYNIQLSQAIICYEYATAVPTGDSKVIQMDDFMGIYQQLLQGNYLQFCELDTEEGITPIYLDRSFYNSKEEKNSCAILACPMLDDQGVLGDLWLFNRHDYIFSELEIRLVQQVANQCAIAIRQARLYQASQTQVKELEKLNRLKDDFLSTVSHELRTPLSNMKMAIQMLAISLNQERSFFAELTKPEAEKTKVARYFQILRDECEREISLIGDLLDLQRLDAGAHTLVMQPIKLPEWLPQIIQPFQDRVNQHQQTLQLNISHDFPMILSDPNSLGRILGELLNNACKYTPAGEIITVNASIIGNQLQLQVCNSGVEIPPQELSRIFDKFYRIPRTDPWQQGGTGLGLTLVKKLINHLGGSIQLQSSEGTTIFTIFLPINYS